MLILLRPQPIHSKHLCHRQPFRRKEQEKLLTMALYVRRGTKWRLRSVAGTIVMDAENDISIQAKDSEDAIRVITICVINVR